MTIFQNATSGAATAAKDRRGGRDHPLQSEQSHGDQLEQILYAKFLGPLVELFYATHVSFRVIYL